MPVLNITPETEAHCRKLITMSSVDDAHEYLLNHPDISIDDLMQWFIINNNNWVDFFVMNGHGFNMVAAFNVAVHANNVSVVGTLLRLCHPPPQCIIEAAGWGHTAIVKLLLDDGRTDPSYDYQYALRIASLRGNNNTVKVLLEDTRVDPSVQKQYCIGMASRNGHIETVKLLLKHPKVVAGGDNNFALRMAADMGNHEIVKLLCAERSVLDDVGGYHSAMDLAIERGYTEVFKTLYTMAPSEVIEDNYTSWVRLAIDCEQMEIIWYLMGKPGWRTEHFTYACKNGSVEMVKQIMTKFDPSTEAQAALNEAVTRGHIEVVKLLLGDDRIDAGAFNNAALYLAIEHERVSIVELLLNQGITINARGAIAAARQKGYGHIANLITDYQLAQTDNLRELWQNSRIVNGELRAELKILREQLNKITRQQAAIANILN